ncbi:MAG: hypothetical protein KKG94_05035 [Nanoarchaeota archaeon]|nr:hypothetical protein [Nanoarchaeota archaeon]
MKAKLIVYELSDLDQYHKVLVNRTLFGYLDNSNNGAYQYKRDGILDKIPHLRLLRGAIIVKDKDQNKILLALKSHKVQPKVFEIGIKSSILH